MERAHDNGIVPTLFDIKIMSKYEIQISEPWDFEYPNGSNAFTAYGVGVIPGPDKPNYDKEFFLLNVEAPFEMDGELVKQLICSPRYEGDSMQMVTSSKCTVGVARVKPQYELSEASSVNIDEVVYCAIGTIKVR